MARLVWNKHQAAPVPHESWAMTIEYRASATPVFIPHSIPDYYKILKWEKTDETLRKRENDKKVGLNYEEDETYDYKLTKEYNWNVKNKASKGYEENFFFCYRPGHGK